MELINILKNFQLFNNSGWDYIQALLCFLGVIIIFNIFKLIILVRVKALAERTRRSIDDFIIKIIKELKPHFYLIIAFYIAIEPLNLNDLFGKIIFSLFIIVLIFQVVLVVQQVVDYILEKKILKNIEGADDAKNKKAVIKLLSQMVKIILWMTGFLMILSNLGVNVTSLVAGLGIGGIAIAFALQGILKDLFASFSIFLDQPFKVGDYVKIGTDSGTIKRIGIKTSRIQTLSGEELILANIDITSSRVRNFSRMKKRRVKYDIGVVYGTSSKKIEEIPKIIEEIVKKEKDTTFGRVRFTTFGEFALIFEVLYHINSSDFDLYLKINEKINLGIYEEFEKKKIKFAYPTQTLHINK